VTVKIAGRAPDGEGNGLTAIAQALIDNPAEMHVVIAIVDCSKTTTDHDKDEVIPTARVRRIEVVDDKDDGKRLRDLMQRAFERRTGKTVLPLELEDELRAAFGDGDDDQS
jgi:hypothetical protein